MPQPARTYRLLAPGPVPVPPEVLAAMSAKVIHHRTPEFEAILARAWAGLKYAFGTEQPVQILCGTGSAAMEAAVVNLISPGDEVLVVVSGKFGERWAEMCERYGARTHRWQIPWGEPASPDAFAAQLKSHPKVRVVFTQVVETSTATLHPVAELARLTRELAPDALFAVDAITAIGCTPLAMDALGLDVVVAGSQKAFMIPTGLSFIALSARAWAAQKLARTPKYYLDLASERAANAKGETHFSTPTPLVVGLERVLARVRERGLDALIARSQALAAATRRAGQTLGLEVYSRAPAPSVTALACADAAKVRDQLEREFAITLMGGQDQLKGKIIRVGHMGDVRDDDLVALFTALADLTGGSDRTPAVVADIRADLSVAPPLF